MPEKVWKPILRADCNPEGWHNVRPHQYFLLARCAALIMQSNLAPRVQENTTWRGLRTLIKVKRLALWISADRNVVIGFHALDGPTNHPERCPKFCICAGMAADVVIPVSMTVADATYASFRAAIKAFAGANENAAALYLLLEDGQAPGDTDRITKFLLFAQTDLTIASEQPNGFTEQYKQEEGVRWASPLQTWQLKKSSDL